MFRFLALLGALPALVAMFIVDRADAKRPEPRWSLRRMAIAGALSTIPAGMLEMPMIHFAPKHGLVRALYIGFVCAAFLEEGAKALCVRYFVWNRPEFDERTDGIVYGTRAGLGFALVENVVYLLTAKSTTKLLATLVGRTVFSVPLHAVTGGIAGHFAAWRRFEGRGPGIVGGMAIAIALHGAFDAAVLMCPVLFEHKSMGLLFFALICPLIVDVAGLRLIRRYWREALARDAADSVIGNELPVRLSEGASRAE